jgi:hypothetical protein
MIVAVVALLLTLLFVLEDIETEVDANCDRAAARD